MEQRENKKTVLVVDDEPDIVEYLGFVLAKFGYQTLTANSAGEALKVVSKAGQPPFFGDRGHRLGR
jgi:CheY-like chemotaxis protein